MTNLFQYVALRHLKMRPGRTAFAVLGIACGIALYVAISIINDSTSGFFRDSMAAVSGKATLTVSAGELGFDEKIADAVEKIEGVSDAVPVVETRSWLLTTNESVMVLGVDLFQERKVRSYKSEGKAIIGDSMTFISQSDSMILTDGFTKAHNLKMDDKLELSTARGKGKFTIRGILAPTGLATAYGGAMAIMDIDAARLAFGKEGKTDRIDVVTRKDADVDVVASRIRAAIGPNFTVERPEMASKEMERMTQSFQFMSSFFSTLALIVGIFLISNSVSISVAERRKEIGTLRALGTKRAGILTLFVSEAFAMGVIGSVLGAFMGRALASYMVKMVTNAMSQQCMQKIESSDLKFTAATVLAAVGIGAFSSILAALWPSFKATKVEPIEAMKRKETGEEAARTSFGRLVGRNRGLIGFVMILASCASSLLLKSPETRVLQIIMQLVAMIGASMLGPALVIGVVRLTRPFIIRYTEMIPRIALDNILRNPKRTSTNVTSLMVGLTLVVIIACVNVSFKGTLMRFFDRILNADLIISTTGRLQTHETQPLNENLKQLIEANNGVLGAYELREVKLNYGNEKLLLKYYGEPPKPEAVPAKAAEANESPLRYNIFDTADRDSEAAGYDLFHSIEPTIMVSENFVVHYHKKTGDLVELMTPKGPRNFRVVAVVREYSNPNGTIFISRKSYREVFDDNLVSGFAVKLKKGYDPVQVRRELDQSLSKQYKLTIMLNSDIRSQVSTVIDNSFAYTRAIEVAALLVALLGLMNTLIITVMERTRELGLSRAIGMTRWHVSRMILIEAASQGSLGALVAMAIGTVLGMLWVTQNLAHNLGWVVSFFVPWNALLSTFALGLIVTLVAAWYPARRAARLDIVEALDYE